MGWRVARRSFEFAEGKLAKLIQMQNENFFVQPSSISLFSLFESIIYYMRLPWITVTLGVELLHNKWILLSSLLV